MAMELRHTSVQTFFLCFAPKPANSLTTSNITCSQVTWITGAVNSNYGRFNRIALYYQNPESFGSCLVKSKNSPTRQHNYTTKK